MEYIKQLRIAFMLMILFTVLTGMIYPAIVTGIAQVFFPWRANGSLITQDNRLMGSVLIGQAFSDPNYFWGRPSATTPYPYNSEASSGSNLGPMNPDFIKTVKDRIHILQQADSQNTASIPVDLVTASASGLDPEISPFAARYQIDRVARARKLPAEKVAELVANFTQQRFLGILGEPGVNVLQLNLALDALERNSSQHKGA